MAFATNISGWLDWQTISFAAAGISVMGAAMLIILSRALNLRNLEQTAKVEFVYAASTVFIVLMVIGLLYVGENAIVAVVRCLYFNSFGIDCTTCSFTPMVGNIPATTLIDYTKLYMETPARCVQDTLHTLYIASIPIESAASVYMEVFMSEQATGYGVKAIAERIKNTTQMLSFYLYIYYVLLHSLNFVKHYAGFFFAIGVALRAFPPTRGAGAYLMAASIGFYFIFPFGYVLIANISLPEAQEGVLTPVGGCQAAIEKGSPYYLCSLPALPFNEEQFRNNPASFSKIIGEIPLIIKSSYDQIVNLLDFRTGYIGKLFKRVFASICLAPLAAAILMLTFILNTTNLFGGNIPEIGRGLVKLI